MAAIDAYELGVDVANPRLEGSVLTTLKAAVLMPIPSVSTRMATKANVGCRRSSRKP